MMQETNDRTNCPSYVVLVSTQSIVLGYYVIGYVW